MVVLAIAVAIAAKRWEQKRAEAMAQVAAAMGFRMDDGAAIASHALPLFDRGHSKSARNGMTGTTADHPVTIIDYRYVIGHGKHRQIHDQTVVIFTELGRGMPDFELAPENFFHKVGQAFGYQDIDFDGSDEFSKQYLLRGPEETSIRSCFSPTVLAFLAGEPGWSAQARGGQLAVFRARSRCKPEEIPSLLADSLRIASGFTRG
jgi:hypothetical protein